VVFKSFGEGLENKQVDKIKLAIFDITKTQVLAKELGIGSTPSFIIFRNGQEMERFYGDRLVKDDIEAFVESVIQ
jgi:thioredoxin-like negative regulator of GroEL